MSATTSSKVNILVRCTLRNDLNFRVAHFLDFKRPCRDIKMWMEVSIKGHFTIVHRHLPTSIALQGFLKLYGRGDDTLVSFDTDIDAWIINAKHLNFRKKRRFLSNTRRGHFRRTLSFITMHSAIDLSTARPPVLVLMIYASLAWILIKIWKPHRSIIILLTNYRTRWWW